MLENKIQVMFKEIVDEYGVENGLSEIVGYFLIVILGLYYLIIEDVKELILIGLRKINVLMVIYIRL